MTQRSENPWRAGIAAVPEPERPAALSRALWLMPPWSGQTDLIRDGYNVFVEIAAGAPSMLAELALARAFLADRVPAPAFEIAVDVRNAAARVGRPHLVQLADALAVRAAASLGELELPFSWSPPPLPGPDAPPGLAAEIGLARGLVALIRGDHPTAAASFDAVAQGANDTDLGHFHAFHAIAGHAQCAWRTARPDLAASLIAGTAPLLAAIAETTAHERWTSACLAVAYGVAHKGVADPTPLFEAIDALVGLGPPTPVPDLILGLPTDLGRVGEVRDVADRTALAAVVQTMAERAVEAVDARTIAIDGPGRTLAAILGGILMEFAAQIRTAT